MRDNPQSLRALFNDRLTVENRRVGCHVADYGEDRIGGAFVQPFSGRHFSIRVMRADLPTPPARGEMIESDERGGMQVKEVHQEGGMWVLVCSQTATAKGK